MRPLLPALAFLAALIATPAMAEEASSPVSEAETLLFLGDQMKSVAPGTTLRYKFARTANLEKEQSFNDTVEVSVSGTPKDKKVATRCLTSSGQKTEVPAVEGAEVNPAILCFLEREIREMERLTGGKAFHFRQQIRRTLADSAAVRDVNVDLEGKRLGAKQIEITPYRDDIFRARFEKYAGKSYVFVLSEGVPGRLYRIETVIPDQEGADRPPLVREVLSYTGTSGGGAKKK
ncbi:MAG TPA: hypothetical protein VF104_06165 [Burkholderiales bacterium]